MHIEGTHHTLLERQVIIERRVRFPVKLATLSIAISMFKGVKRIEKMATKMMKMVKIKSKSLPPTTARCFLALIESARSSGTRGCNATIENACAAGTNRSFFTILI